VSAQTLAGFINTINLIAAAAAENKNNGCSTALSDQKGYVITQE
jgi:hypothetical protein